MCWSLDFFEEYILYARKNKCCMTWSRQLIQRIFVLILVSVSLHSIPKICFRRPFWSEFVWVQLTVKRVHTALRYWCFFVKFGKLESNKQDFQGFQSK